MSGTARPTYRSSSVSAETSCGPDTFRVLLAAICRTDVQAATGLLALGGTRTLGHEMVGEVLEADPPYNARVVFDCDSAATGWNAPAVAPWLSAAADTFKTWVVRGPRPRGAA